MWHKFIFHYIFMYRCTYMCLGKGWVGSDGGHMVQGNGRCFEWHIARWEGKLAENRKFYRSTKKCSYSHILIPQIFTEFLIFAKYCSSYWEYNEPIRYDPCSHRAYILMWETNIKQTAQLFHDNCDECYGSICAHWYIWRMRGYN